MPSYSNIYIDFETRSEVRLREQGTAKYVMGDTFDILCLAFKFHDEPTKLWIGNAPKLKMKNLATKDDISRLKRSVEKGHRVVMHNRSFDFLVWNAFFAKKYGFPLLKLKQTRCTAELARCLGFFPSSLEALSNYFNGTKKDKVGHSLINKLCRPNKKNEYSQNKEEFERFFNYCTTDVDALYGIHKDMAFLELPEIEQQFADLTLISSIQGLGWDIDMSNKLVELNEAYVNNLNNNIEKLTKGKVTKVTQAARLKDYFKEAGLNGTGQDELAKVAMFPEAYNLTVNDKKILKVLKSRSSAVDKHKKAVAMDIGDGVIRGFHYYFGAHTGRTQGSGINIMNLPRPVANSYNEKELTKIKKSSIKTLLKNYDTPTLIKDVTRGCIVPQNDKFLIMDYAKIEFCILHWIAGDTDTLDKVKQGFDPYIEMAELCFNTKGVKKGSHERNVGKCIILGCGYQQGAASFQRYCNGQGVKVTLPEADKFVKIYRKKYRQVVNFWYTIKRQVEQKIRANARKGKPFYMTLPSGRKFYYRNIVRAENSFGDAFAFVNSKGQTVTLNGGTIVENVCQAICRDIMVSDYVLLHKKGFNPVFSVYDEIVMDVNNKVTEKQVEKLLSRPRKEYKGLLIEREYGERGRYGKI